jgi:hypothetical protein
MVPAEFLARAVAVGADPLAEPPNLRNQLVPIHPFEIFVHSDDSSIFFCELPSTSVPATAPGEGREGAR